MTETGDHSSTAHGAASVSVLVTTFNHARYVEEALESLRRQTSRDFEVIITDDASTDGCADIIAQWLARTGFAAQFIRNPVNRGICANRNTALARASGTFVCSLSGDDAYEPERIARQLACFRAQPDNVCAVYSDALLVDAEASLGQMSAGGRGDITAVGGYDESLFYEDFDMSLRLSSRFSLFYICPADWSGCRFTATPCPTIRDICSPAEPCF